MPSAAVPVLPDDTTGATSQRVANYPNFARSFDTEPERKWQTEVQKHLLRYAKLPHGWDSYNAKPIGWDAGLFALSILSDFMRPRTPIPQVVPSTAGGVQLEWHQKGVDLELHVTGPYQCEIWFKDHRTPNDPPLALDLTDDYSALRKPFDLLTSR
jgi:hypothetical protein